jgi:putative peptidoglycan lipid II flippase
VQRIGSTYKPDRTARRDRVAAMPLARSTLTVTFFSLANAALALGAQLVIAYVHGAGRETDAYFVATTFSFLLVSIVATVGPTALVPIFVESRTERGEAAAWSFASTLVAGFACVLCVFAASSFLWAKPLIGLVAPGLEPAQRTLAAALLRACTPIIVFMGLSTVLTGIYQARSAFAVPAASMLLIPLGTMVGAALSSSSVGIRAAVFGQAAGALAQVLVLAVPLVRRSRLWIPRVKARIELALAVRMMAPYAMGGFAYQALPMIERFFGSVLPVGSISYLSIASRIGNSLMPLLVAGLATTLFTRLAAHGAVRDLEGARQTLSLSLRVLAVIAVPIALFSPFYADPLVRLLLVRGRFVASDAAAVTAVVPFYVLGSTALGCGMLVERGFHSLLKDTLTPSVNVAVNMLLYVVVCTFLAPRFGYAGLAVAFAFFWCSTMLMSSLLLRRRLGSRGGRRIASVGLRCVLAAGASAALMAGAYRFVSALPLRLLVIGAGLALYAAIAHRLLHVSEIRLVVMRLRGMAEEPAAD